MRVRPIAVLAAVALTGIVAGGSAASAQEANAQEGGGDDRPGVTDTEIRVGGVASKTNPLGGNYAGAFEGVEAYFEMVNSDGGIDGRDLKLVSKRDDQVGQNRQEVQALISQEDIFAVLPVSVLLFTGADLLADAGIPTFGWNINAEWGSEDQPGAPNLFGEKGSYLCFTCATPLLPWLAKKVKADNVGVLAYNVPQSTDCAEGIEASFDKYPSAEIAFLDRSLQFGVADLSAQVAQMKEEDVDLVTTCMDSNGVLTLAKEMRKQQLDAIQYLPNAYDHEFMEENGQFFEGSYALTFFTPFEVRPKPEGLKLYQKWMKRTDGEQNENSLAGWINADLFVAGLRAAGPDFTQQSVVDAVNSMTDYTAQGLLAPVDWTVRHNSEPECSIISKIEDSEFDPVFGKKGKPFICFPADPDKLPKQPTRV